MTVSCRYEMMTATLERFLRTYPAHVVVISAASSVSLESKSVLPSRNKRRHSKARLAKVDEL